MANDIEHVTLTITNATLTVSISREALRRLFSFIGPLKAEPKPTQAPVTSDKLAYSIKDTVAALGLSRSRIYDLLATGELQAVRIGRRTIIRVDSIRDYLATVPDAKLSRRVGKAP